MYVLPELYKLLFRYSSPESPGPVWFVALRKSFGGITGTRVRVFVPSTPVVVCLHADARWRFKLAAGLEAAVSEE